MSIENTKKQDAVPTLDKKETEDLLQQVEEFEGPDRREKRGTEPEPPRESGVARS
jgi:hypothetical protein